MPISREPVKAVIRRSFSVELSLPIAWLDTYGRRRLGRPLEKIFRLPDPSASGAPRDSLRSPFAAKIVCLRPGASRRSPSASVSRLRLCFVVSAVADIATRRKPQNMLVQTNRAGDAAALPVSVVFRQHHCRLSSDVNWFRHGAFFHLARPTLTLLAGDFVPGFQDCPERAGP